jgi:hypothetical protein
MSLVRAEQLESATSVDAQLLPLLLTLHETVPDLFRDIIQDARCSPRHLRLCCKDLAAAVGSTVTSLKVKFQPAAAKAVKNAAAAFPNAAVLTLTLGSTDPHVATVATFLKQFRGSNSALLRSITKLVVTLPNCKAPFLGRHSLRPLLARFRLPSKHFMSYATAYLVQAARMPAVPAHVPGCPTCPHSPHTPRATTVLHTCCPLPTCQSARHAANPVYAPHTDMPTCPLEGGERLAFPHMRVRTVTRCKPWHELVWSSTCPPLCWLLASSTD